MKFPKSILICGVNYKVVFDKKVLGGEFYWAKHLIKIEKGLDNERKFAILLHEICEAIMVENFMRFQKCIDGPMHNGDYLFVFNHDNFEIFTNFLAGILYKSLK